MQKPFTLLAALGIATTVLSSCSRSNYAFTTVAPAYLGLEKAQTLTTAANNISEQKDSTPAKTTALPIQRPLPTPAATAVAKHATQPQATVQAAAPEVPAANAITSTIAKTSYTRAERKAIRHQVKQIIASHTSTTAEGKSQLVAVLLCFFLGGLGIHDFYMGRVGKGILQIFLSILIVGFILVIIDFVRLLTGDLKPKDGDWAKKL